MQFIGHVHSCTSEALTYSSTPAVRHTPASRTSDNSEWHIELSIIRTLSSININMVLCAVSSAPRADHWAMDRSMPVSSLTEPWIDACVVIGLYSCAAIKLVVSISGLCGFALKLLLTEFYRRTTVVYIPFCLFKGTLVWVKLYKASTDYRFGSVTFEMYMHWMFININSYESESFALS